MTNEYLQDSTIYLDSTSSLADFKKLSREELPRRALLSSDAMGLTTAHKAARAGCLEVLKWFYELSKTDYSFKWLLLSQDREGYTIAQHAAAYDEVAVLEWIEEIAKTDENFKPLLVAEKFGGEVAKQVSWYRKIEVLKLLCRLGESFKDDKDYKEAKTFLMTKNNTWDTIAYWAVKYGNLEVLKLVYKVSKIDSDFKHLYLEKDEDGYSIIHLAVWEGQLEILEWIYETSKTDSDFKHLLLAKSNYNRNIAHYAVDAGELEVLKWLYEVSKDDPDFKKLLLDTDEHGYTIVHDAAAYGEVEILNWVREIAETDKDFKRLLKAKDAKGRNIFNRAYTYLPQVKNFIKQSSMKTRIIRCVRAYTRNSKYHVEAFIYVIISILNKIYHMTLPICGIIFIVKMVSGEPLLDPAFVSRLIALIDNIILIITKEN